MASSTIFMLVGLSLMCIIYLPSMYECIVVDCYVCNYSPKEDRAEEWCTRDKFKAEFVRTTQCEKGCEQVALYDSNNVLELFYRNCYRQNETATDKSYKQDLKNSIREVYVCTTNLCNSSESLHCLSWTLLLVIATSCSWWFVKG